MPYGYTDEQWNKMDAFTKSRIQSQAQKQAPKAQAKPKTTTTTPKTTTTTTSTSATQPTQGSAATAAATYNPTTGTGTFDDGTQYTKYTWEPDPNDPSKLYRTNVGTGARLADDYIPNPQYTPTQTQPQDPYADMLAEIERRQRELAEAQRQSRIAALGKQKEQALSSLQAEEAALKPYYYDLRNRTAAQSDIAAKNFAEYMAAQGIRGSAAGLPEIYRQSALQGQLGTLNRQEAADIADIARRRSGIESAYESDVAAAMADIDAQTLQNYIDNMRIMQAQRAADLAAQGKTSTGELTLQGRQAQQNELAQQAALLAARYYDDIQAYINTLDPNDPLVPYLYAERQKKIQTEAEKAAAAAAAASEEEQRAWKRAFDLFQSTGRITSAEQARILGLPMGATVADVDIARMNAQTARMNAQTAATNANETNEPSASDIYNNAVKNIDSSMYVYKDTDGKIVVSNPQGLRNYIISLNLPDELTDSLLLRYGLPINQ